jgi:hypothetical protein
MDNENVKLGIQVVTMFTALVSLAEKGLTFWKSWRAARDAAKP